MFCNTSIAVLQTWPDVGRVNHPSISQGATLRASNCWEKGKIKKLANRLISLHANIVQLQRYKKKIIYSDKHVHITDKREKRKNVRIRIARTVFRRQ